MNSAIACSGSTHASALTLNSATNPSASLALQSSTASRPKHLDAAASILNLATTPHLISAPMTLPSSSRTVRVNVPGTSMHSLGSCTCAVDTVVSVGMPPGVLLRFHRRRFTRPSSVSQSLDAPSTSTTLPGSRVLSVNSGAIPGFMSDGSVSTTLGLGRVSTVDATTRGPGTPLRAASSASLFAVASASTADVATEEGPPAVTMKPRGTALVLVPPRLLGFGAGCGPYWTPGAGPLRGVPC
mgnify:CR=1 FL=1